MRNVPLKTTADTGASDIFEPRTNDVGISVGITAAGACNATFQVKGRSSANLPTQDIGSPVTVSGTGSATTTVNLTNNVAGQVWADFSVVSCTSLRVEATEADR